MVSLRSIVVLCMLLLASSSLYADEPVRLIFDTDIMGDVDDVGTVAVLHALADEGEVEILAMGVSGKNPWCPLCLDALNVYFQRPGKATRQSRLTSTDRDQRNHRLSVAFHRRSNAEHHSPVGAAFQSRRRNRGS
jgi:hypothetical protein